MNWYICVITSTDYYTMYDSVEIVKAKSTEDAEEKAKQAYKDREHIDGFGSYRQVEEIIYCGAQKPKVKR